MNFIPYLKTKWFDIKLRTKLIIAFLLVVVAGIIVVTSVINYSTKLFFNDYVQQLNRNRAVQWRNYFESYYINNQGNWDGIQKYFSESGQFQLRGFNRGMAGMSGMSGMAAGDRITVVNQKDLVVADSIGTGLGEKPPRLENKTEAVIYVNDEPVGKVILGLNHPYGIATLEQRFFKSVIIATIAASVIAILLAVGIALYFSRRISVPLVSLTEAAQRLAGKDFKYRLFIPSGDEIGALSRAFNTMADAIEENEQIRNQLVADVAHELRTPITIIRGSLESIQAGVMEPSQEVIVSLHDELLRLSRLIKDLQEISLAESGKLVLNYKQVSPVDLLANVVIKFKGLAAAKGISLVFYPPGDDVVMNVDPDRVTQILANIINNAIAHTPQGRRVETFVEYSGENLVCFSVVDNGAGIPAEDLPYIFERFYRSDKSRNRTEGGTGLGLAIAKSFAEAHGGKLEVECPAKGGSIFKIWLPVKR